MTQLNDVERTIREKHRLDWIMHMSWPKLTAGEKVARVVLKTLRFAAIAAVVAVVASVIIGVGLGILFAMGICGAITGGFENASRTNTNRFYGHYRW